MGSLQYYNMSISFKIMLINLSTFKFEECILYINYTVILNKKKILDILLKISIDILQLVVDQTIQIFKIIY